MQRRDELIQQDLTFTKVYLEFCRSTCWSVFCLHGNVTAWQVPPVPVSEAKERASIPATSFLFTYPPVAAIPDNADGAIRNLFIDSSPALGTLPNNGLGQSWLTLVSCGVW